MPKRPLIALFISLSSGIIFFERLPLDRSYLLHAGMAALAITTALMIFFKTRSVLMWVAFFLAGGIIELYAEAPSAIRPHAQARAMVKLEATVLEPAETQGDAARFTVMASQLIHGDNTLGISEKIRVTVYRNCPSLTPGEKILFPARLKPFSNFKNPGAYDYEKAMKLQGVACAASVSDGMRIVRLGKGELGRLEALGEYLKRPAREFLFSHLKEERLSVLRALLLGERQDFPSSLREQFARTGLSHALAVSGLHVGMTAWAAFVIIRWLMLRSYRLALAVDVQRWAALLAFFPALLYCLLAGFQVSTQRALIMIGIFLLSVFAGRSRDTWSTLAMAGIVILAFDPGALFSISFQLSFGAVSGILLLGPLLMLPLRGKVLKKPVLYLAGIASATISATIFLLPITSHYFNQVSLVSIPANLFVVPILGLWVLPLGLISCLLLFVFPPLAHHALAASALGVDLMLAAIDMLSAPDWAAVWVATPNILETALFLAAAAVTPSAFRNKRAKIVLAFLIFIIGADTAYWTYRIKHRENLSVTYIDVAQGNAALLEMPGGRRMLIDGGGFAGDSFDVGRFVVAPFLWSKKIRSVDYIVLSHPQADHMNGLRFIAGAFSVKEFWHSGAEADSDAFRDLMEIIKEREIRERRLPRQEDRIEVGGVIFHVLNPPPQAPLPTQKDKKADLNNLSLALKADFKGAAFLFAGDVEAAAERGMVERAGGLLSSDVLLAPHHGSKTSCTDLFLSHVRPKICVISSGRQAISGFPHKEAIDRIIAAGAIILRTDTEGAVEVTAIADELRVESFAGTQLVIKKKD